MRKTQARKTIEKIFKSTKKPVKLSSLFAEIKNTLPNTAYSTVYRIVEKLEQENKITKVDWRDRGSFFEWSGRSHHHHIVCQNCDFVADINDASISYDDQEVAEKTGFTSLSHSIEIYGLCKPCQEQKTS